MGKMEWYAGGGKHFSSPMGHYAARLEDGTRIEVHADLYDAQWNAYLERLGAQRTSWFEIMHRAEQEWNAYCRLMDAFAENLEQWGEYHGAGVFIEQAAVQAQKGEEEAGSCF